MARFIGIIHKDEDSDYGVCFPDFPGCVTAGKTLDEAMQMAAEALRGHIEVMHEYADAMPSRGMGIEQARKHEFAENAELFIGVEAALPSKPVRVNVMLDGNLLKRIENVEKNRSAFINRAVEHELGRLQEQ
jgi:predicted RNase H-like HicB family nuclease